MRLKVQSASVQLSARGASMALVAEATEKSERSRAPPLRQTSLQRRRNGSSDQARSILASKVGLNCHLTLRDQERPRIPQEEYRGMTRVEQLELKYNQAKVDINCEEYHFREVESRWESELSEGSLYNDYFQADLFQEDDSEFREGSLYYMKKANADWQGQRAPSKAQILQKSFGQTEEGREMLKAMMKAQTVVKAPPTATEEERKNIEAFNILLLKKKLGQFQGIRRELAMRQRLHRSLTLNDNFSFKIINGNPEVRFRVARPQYRGILVSKIRQELAHKKKAQKEKRKIEKERKKME